MIKCNCNTLKSTNAVHVETPALTCFTITQSHTNSLRKILSSFSFILSATDLYNERKIHDVFYLYIYTSIL